jgi:hypothetical protein
MLDLKILRETAAKSKKKGGPAIGLGIVKYAWGDDDVKVAFLLLFV